MRILHHSASTKKIPGLVKILEEHGTGTWRAAVKIARAIEQRKQQEIDAIKASYQEVSSIFMDDC